MNSLPIAKPVKIQRLNRISDWRRDGCWQEEDYWQDTEMEHAWGQFLHEIRTELGDCKYKLFRRMLEV